MWIVIWIQDLVRWILHGMRHVLCWGPSRQTSLSYPVNPPASWLFKQLKEVFCRGLFYKHASVVQVKTPDCSFWPTWTSEHLNAGLHVLALTENLVSHLIPASILMTQVTMVDLQPALQTFEMFYLWLHVKDGCSLLAAIMGTLSSVTHCWSSGISLIKAHISWLVSRKHVLVSQQRYGKERTASRGKSWEKEVRAERQKWTEREAFITGKVQMRAEAWNCHTYTNTTLLELVGRKDVFNLC